jgi:hypothetical protein
MKAKGEYYDTASSNLDISHNLAASSSSPGR